MQLLVIVGIGLLVKFAFIDVVKVNGEQMSPGIITGDYILMFRTPYLPGIRNLLKPRLRIPVVFTHPHEHQKRGSLRIAGISGDTVSIDSGRFLNSRNPTLRFPPQGKKGDVVPENFSPRDFFQPYSIPASGDNLNLDELSLRDFFFAVSIIRQENKGNGTIEAQLLIDDSVHSDYFISDFSLHSGSIDSIPEQYRNDWFFWSRLLEYLKHIETDKHVTLNFSYILHGNRIKQYTVRNTYAFLLADNWNSGLDSRYFGPVSTGTVFGRAFLTLWSYGKTPGKSAHLRTERLGRIIR